MKIIYTKRKKGEMFSFWSIRKGEIITDTANTLEEAIKIAEYYKDYKIEIRQRWF